MRDELPIEKSIKELEEKIKELKKLSVHADINLSTEIKALEEKSEKFKLDYYQNLNAWDKIKLARHPQRLITLDYVENIFKDFTELHGDRSFRDDPAIIGGLAYFNSKPVMIVGHQKGKDTKKNLARNFGMPYPEGFKKAARLMKMAEKFNVPIISFIDTPGAYPGIGAEERGQFVAIAENIMLMSQLTVPIIIVVIGEGGSGGALGIALGDRVLMMENAYYSVISPEGCASILWRDAAKADEAAKALKLTAQDLIKLEIIDEIIMEPLGGVHKDHALSINNVKKVIAKHLGELEKLSTDELLEKRYEKFRKMGVFEEEKV